MDNTNVQMPVTPSAGGNKKMAVSVAVGVIVLAGLISWWYFLKSDKVLPSPSPSLTPTPVVDDNIQDLQQIDTSGNLDGEFQGIDQELNNL